MILFLLIACKGNQELSPTATAKVVIESFYTKDNSTLKEHTTPSGYEGMIAIQNFVADGMSKSSDFKVVNDSIIGKLPGSNSGLPMIPSLKLLNLSDKTENGWSRSRGLERRGHFKV